VNGVELALYRQVGTPAVMAGQMRRLAEIAAMPLVTLTVMPAIAHAANASGFVLADDAAWCEHMAAGGVYTDPQSLPGSRSASITSEQRATAPVNHWQ
jgi:hypothetical protein